MELEHCTVQCVTPTYFNVEEARVLIKRILRSVEEEIEIDCVGSAMQCMQCSSVNNGIIIVLIAVCSNSHSYCISN